MMGFKQNDDGAVSWGYGSTYVKYDIMGRKAFNRRLPAGYSDFSHSLDPMPNGHYLLRVASADLRRLDQKRVRTVRDMIIEVDARRRVSMNGVSLIFSIRTAATSSRHSTRGLSA